MNIECNPGQAIPVSDIVEAINSKEDRIVGDADQIGTPGSVGFGVGAYISNYPPIEMTMDIKVIEGKPIAKRGRLPGLSDTSRLKVVYDEFKGE